VSIRSWLGEFAEAAQLAEFLQQEMPIRYAERIRNIDTWWSWSCSKAFPIRKRWVSSP